jgi:hypothetical protein
MSKAAELANLIGNINAGGGGVGRNLFINGAMNVAQRGTSSTGLGTTAGYYTTDRWHLALNSNTAGRLTMTQDSSAPSGFANSTKLACTTADTSIASGEQVIFQQKIEGQNLQTLAKGTSDAKPLALSFYVKGNASATYVAALYEGDNSRYVGKTFSVTTDWTRVEITFPADTTGALDDDNASSLELWIWLHAGSTYKGGTLPLTWASYSNANAAEGADSFFDSTSRTFFITGVQLEVGQNATEFEHEPFERTLKKCERYYYLKGKGAATYLGNGGYTANSEVDLVINFPTTMRSAPSLEQVSGTNYYNAISPDGTDTLNDFVIHQSTIYSILIYNNSDASGSSGYYAALSIANASGYIAFSSEL